MVYNCYHRQHATAYQKAIRLLSGAHGNRGRLETELAMTREIIADGRLPGSMAGFLSGQRDLPEPAVSDSLLQPSLNQLDKVSGQFSWDPPLPEGMTRQAFDSQDDPTR